MLFLGTNWSDVAGGNMYKEKGYWTIDIHTEFKDYESETDKFIDWITPYIVGRKAKQYLGWSKNENVGIRINIYIERKN